MNDPGLDSPISDEERIMESRERSDKRDVVEEDEQAFLAPRCVFSDRIRGTRKVHLLSTVASFLSRTYN
jgi:hypothetical protein